MVKKLYGPLNVQWEVTPKCNYRCIHCYNYWRAADETTTNNCWSLQNGHKIVDEIIKSQVNSVTITGGEPLLVFDIIMPYINRLINNGISVSLNTNASCINDSIASYLKEKDISILVSLPCAIPEINDKITSHQGSFIATINGIRIAQKYGVRLSINMVVSKINQEYVVSTAEFVKNELKLMGFNATKAGRPINAGDEYGNYDVGIEDLRKLLRDLVLINQQLELSVDSLNAYPQCSYVTEESFKLIGHRRKCTAGRTGAAIGYDGSVKACARDQQSYGNLQEDSLIECWNRMSDWRDNSLLPEGCKECNQKEICAGACRVEALVSNGSKKAKDNCVDFSNIPIKFSSPKTSIIQFSDIEQFVLQNVQVLKEEFGYRLTIGSQSQFITEELCEFINKHNDGNPFTKQDVKSYFEIEDNSANQLLSWMMRSSLVTV